MSINIDSKTEKFFDVCREIIQGKISLIGNLEPSEREIIIANFQNLKEEYINKVMHSNASYTLEFDYDKGKRIIWDLLFLREYVLKHCDANYQQRMIEEVKGKAKTDAGASLKYPNVDVDIISLESLSQDQENVIKEAVVIFQKIRDCFSHQNIPIDSNDSFVINSIHKDSCFVCDIPVKYLRFFGSHIVPTAEHREVASTVDQFVSNLNLKLRETSVEYRLHPANLKRLIEVSGNEDWKDLPMAIISCTEKRFRYLLDKVNNDVEKLKSLPPFVFNIDSQKLETFLKYIGNDITKIGNYKEDIVSAPRERLEQILSMLNNDISRLNEFPTRLFKCPNEQFQIYLEMVQQDVQKLLTLPKEIFNARPERLKYWYYEKGLTVEEICNLAPHLLMLAQDELEMYLRIVDGDISRLNEMAYFARSTNFSEDEIREVLKILGNQKDIFLDWLSKQYQYVKKDGIFYWLSYFKSHNVAIEDIVALPALAFWGNNECIDYLLTIVDNDVTKLASLPSAVYTSSKDKISFLLSLVDNQVSRLQEFILDSVLETEQNIIFASNCSNEKIDYLYRLVNNDISRLREIPITLFPSSCSIERLDFFKDYIIREYGSFDISILANIPTKAFTCSEERLKELLARSKKLETLNDMSNYLFNEIVELKKIDKLLEHLKDDKGGYDFTPLKYVSWTVFKCSSERLDLILKLVNYDISQLTKIPRELYVCKDDAMVEQLYTQYSENMIKSIFGISEEKVIALMLYMGTIFRTIPDDVATYDSFTLSGCDISGIEMIHPTTNMIAQHNALHSDISQSTFLKKSKVKELTEYSFQSIDTLPTNKIRRCVEVQNKELYRVLRNCSEHLRIYPIDSMTVKLIDGNFEAKFDVAVLYEIIDYFKNRVMGNKDSIAWDNELAHRLALFNGHKQAEEEKKTVRLYANQVDEYIEALEDKTRVLKIKNLFVHSDPKTYGRICKQNQSYYLTTVVYSKINYLKEQGYEVVELSLDEEDAITVTVTKDGTTIQEKLNVLVPPGVVSSIEQSPIIQNLKFK